MVNNTIQIEVYKTGTTRAIDASNELPLAQTVSFGSYYPGGIYGDATLYVPRDVLRWWALKGAQRIVFRWRRNTDHLYRLLGDKAHAAAAVPVLYR